VFRYYLYGRSYIDGRKDEANGSLGSFAASLGPLLDTSKHVWDKSAFSESIAMIDTNACTESRKAVVTM